MNCQTFLNRHVTFKDAFREYLREDVVFLEWPISVQAVFVKELLKVLAKQLGGLSYFYFVTQENEIIEGWIEGFLDYKPSQILDAAQEILKGNYEVKGNVAPRNALEFIHFMKDIRKQYESRVWREEENKKPLKIETGSRLRSDEEVLNAKQHIENMCLTLKQTGPNIGLHTRTGVIK
jgi:hypothetical protein